MGEYRYRENVKRGMAFVLAIILGGMAFLPGFPAFPAKAAPAIGQQTALTTAHGDTLLGHKLYCIDKGGYAIWGIVRKRGVSMKAHRTLPGIRSAEQSGTEICILGDALAQSRTGG